MDAPLHAWWAAAVEMRLALKRLTPGERREKAAARSDEWLRAYA